MTEEKKSVSYPMSRWEMQFRKPVEDECECETTRCDYVAQLDQLHAEHQKRLWRIKVWEMIMIGLIVGAFLGYTFFPIIMAIIKS